MSKRGFSFSGLLLSGLFAGIVGVLCFGIFDILSQPFFEAKIVFMAVNVLIVIIMSCFSRELAYKLTVPMFTAIAASTGIYTMIQFAGFVVFSFLGAADLNLSNWYILFQLVLHLIYFAVIIPIGKAGRSIAEKDNKAE